MTAQDKILHVASKLGLSSLQNMQASTGAVYDVDLESAGQFFTNSSRHLNPAVTNLTENQFEVNEALLIETISFYSVISGGTRNFQEVYGSNAVILFDVIIGNKKVMKQVPVFGAGMPYTFANTAVISGIVGEDRPSLLIPRHQVFMEGAGILIPPQIQFSVQYQIFDVVTGLVVTPIEDLPVGCYLYGTKVLLNFNTTI